MILKFNTNENPFSLVAHVQKAAIKGLKEINRYSELKYLYEFKTLLGNYNNVPSDNIVVNHGSDLLLREFINIFSKDRKIITVNPSFFPISKYALQQARKLTKIQLSPPDFKFNHHLLLNELNEPSLIVIDNPNNPTGKILADDNLVEKILQNENTLLLIDEAYYEFSGQTFAAMIKKYPNLAITRTMDKAFSLAGLRLGYLLIGDFFKDHFSDFPAFLSKPTLFAATEALKNPVYMTANVNKIMSEKTRLGNELAQIGIQVFQGSANFILIKSNLPDFGKRLMDAEILIKDLSDEWIEGFYRISMGLPEENNALLSIITKICADD
ncbi:MAG: aminotransferase class I/II-fold pyridoxal phosphate-dependent enzyme [Bacteroidales bacterium]|nr:aminotransferase class I/II-fold pyridoxal phosphate-dependent enzyme [Bacteroidales bacterium]MDD3010277.1 aminotransferase class I/II-fold pyridoxal phosphate-dependent enzyme [Bacteroidales bacterium]MDD3961517.1 aminotransferase class I/II-fold pyridoxal phosphate-dependent enzyme [Bacteroidales bacterium]MDY0286623.1 aminotransferase class I/II-fold pyridoxal phosphate-dependent enzyme [Bacteroidales bacterium]HPE87390.1 aminotransferase class I/II-fold pyridoxal phosphate-dependent enz